MATEGMSVDRMEARNRYAVAAVEPDQQQRNHLSIQLAGLAAATFETVEALLDHVEPGLPAVAVFGPSLANDTGLAQVQRIGRTRPEVGVVLVAEELSTALLQQALRTGVRDAVTVDAEDAQMRQAVERVGETLAVAAGRERAGADVRRLGRVIVAFSTKGGVGKSVIATNLAVALAQRSGEEVAIVDADLQFGDVAVLLGVPPQHTTIDAAGAIEDADEDMMATLLGKHGATGLRVLPAPIEPSAGDQITPQAMIEIVSMLQRMYSYVVVDMPPHFDDVVLALLEAADDVLLVASMDIPSIKNLKVGMQTLDLLALAGDKMRLVLNRANAKVNLDIADVERAVGVPARYRIPSDISVPQAVNRGVPVVLDKPRSAAALALIELADSFLEPSEPGDAPDDDARRFSWRRQD